MLVTSSFCVGQDVLILSEHLLYVKTSEKTFLVCYFVTKNPNKVFQCLRTKYESLCNTYWMAFYYMLIVMLLKSFMNAHLPSLQCFKKTVATSAVQHEKTKDQFLFFVWCQLDDTFSTLQCLHRVHEMKPQRLPQHPKINKFHLYQHTHTHSMYYI